MVGGMQGQFELFYALFVDLLVVLYELDGVVDCPFAFLLAVAL